MIPKYRLIDLGWYNFETLCKTLLKTVIGSGVSSFGGTKDKGRDASFEGEASFPSKDTKWDGYWIFQVKHSEMEKLNNDKEEKQFFYTLKNEILNIKNRNQDWPDNYILIVNFSLVNSIKDKIKPFVKKLGFEGNFHLIDGNEVCEFLDIYPQIRRNYPQLLGITDLDNIINKDLYTRSEAVINFWKPRLSCFVAVKPYFKALEKLKTHHFVLLDGPPEIGKSFIAVAISFIYATEGYEIISVDKPNEIFRIIGPGKKQIFLADDAVGSIRFDPELGNYWSKNLPAILGKLDKNHKLIWTARSYILKDALNQTKLQEDLDKFPSIYEILIEIEDYTPFEKGLMLYNHCRQNKLQHKITDFIKRKAFFICLDKNITPERIRQLVQNVFEEIYKGSDGLDDSAFLKKIKEFLDNPGDRFYKAYNSLNQSERELLLTILDFGKATNIKNLKESYEERISRF